MADLHLKQVYTISCARAWATRQNSKGTFFFNKHDPSAISVLTLPTHLTMRCPVQPTRGRETICSISAVLLAFEKLLEILLQIRCIRIASLTGEISVNKGFYWAKGQKRFSKAQHNHLELKMRNIFSNRSQWEFLSRQNVIIQLKISHDIADFTSTFGKKKIHHGIC